MLNKGNTFNDCYGHRTVKYKAIPDYQDNLRSLFENNHKRVTHFFNVFEIIIVHFCLHLLMPMKLICLQ